MIQTAYAFKIFYILRYIPGETQKEYGVSFQFAEVNGVVLERLFGIVTGRQYFRSVISVYRGRGF